MPCLATMICWRNLLVSTDPANFSKAEMNIGNLYNYHGLQKPAFVRCASPLDLLCEYAANRRATGRMVPELFNDTIDDAHAIILDHAAYPNWQRIQHAMMMPLAPSVHAISNSIRTSLRIAAKSMKLLQNLRISNLPLFGAHEDAARLAPLDGLCEKYLPAQHPISFVMNACKSAGHILLTRKTAFIAARPLIFHHDDLGRPHCEFGPAIVWRDGSAVHAWRGKPLPVKAPLVADQMAAD
jgi:hypothetical protein